MIKIHFDFVDGTEVSYSEGLVLKDGFSTNCLDFFCFDNLDDADDIVVIKKNGDYLSAVKMLSGKHQYCDREIRFGHNIQKMLKAGVFEVWDKLFCEYMED